MLICFILSFKQPSCYSHMMFTMEIAFSVETEIMQI